MMTKHPLKIWNVCFLFIVLFCLVGAPDALAANIAGTYTGTYSGTDSGTVTITIDTYGNVFCSLVDNAGNNASGNGSAIGSAYALSSITCATTLYFCPAGSVCFEPFQPEFNLGLTGNVQAGPARSTTSIQGSWFTIMYDNNGSGDSGSGGHGMFTATYSAAADPVSTVNVVLLSGLWYDPKYNGSGFNITGSTAGLIVTYYGWDKSGHRLWLTSAVGPAQITMGSSITLDLLQTSDGTFVVPAPSSSSTKWGTLALISSIAPPRPQH